MRHSNNKRPPILGILLILLGLLAAIYFAKDLIFPKPSKQTVKDVYPNEATTSTVDIPKTNAEKAPEQGVINTMPSSNITAPRDRLSQVHGAGNESELVSLPSKYTRKNEQIHKDVYDPLMAMIAAAQKDGVSLSVVSAYRSYKRQKQIWENKWGGASDDDSKKALSILKWSSFPGMSRHHWGTEVDFNSVALNYWQSAQGIATHQWLVNNAPSFGFCQVYVPNREKGYSEEPWHWSHIPTADRYFGQIQHPEILQITLNQPVKGAQAVRSLGTAMDYVTTINHCAL